MPASEAQVRANQANAQKSTGPKTEAGKEKSRANALKHGLTGAGVVMPERAAAEVDRRYGTYAAELKPTGEVSLALVLRAATLSVRMETCVDMETAAVAAAVRMAMDEFEAPEGTDTAEIAKLMVAAGKRAIVEPTQEIINIRKYEAAAERSFYRALKELRQLQKVAKSYEPACPGALIERGSGSFSDDQRREANLTALERRYDLSRPPMPSRPTDPAEFEAFLARADVPITIGKRR